MGVGISAQLDSVHRGMELLKAKHGILLEKALRSNNPSDLIKANSLLNQINKRQESDRKSFVVDPQEFNQSLRYKDRAISLSYSMLRNMAKTPIINAIIKTRLNQMATFLEPQKDNYSVGYAIRKKKIPGLDSTAKLTLQEEKEIFFITEFLENTGKNNRWGGDDFDTFGRKFMYDSMCYDQGTFEVVRNRKGVPEEFWATDSSTMRIAKSSDDTQYERSYKSAKEIMGYYPSHVQIYNNEVTAEFYPWELCFGVRNGQTNIYNQGYGISELEELVSVITALLWSEQYNRNFFKQGSAPKGLFKVQGGMNDSNLQQFRQQWNAMMKGVTNSWKTPFLEADKIDYVDLQKTNRDMEFSNWVEFLIKVSCAVFSIDPAEVNFPLSGGANSSAMFEGQNENRVKHSKDKGLYPLLKFLQKRLNKYIVSNFFDGKYELYFAGLDSMTRKEEADLDQVVVKTYKTLNEVRKEKGLDELEGGDIILDSIFSQNVQQAQQQEQQQQMDAQQQEEQGQEDENPFAEETDNNPFKKALNSYLEKLNLD